MLVESIFHVYSIEDTLSIVLSISVIHIQNHLNMVKNILTKYNKGRRMNDKKYKKRCSTSLGHYLISTTWLTSRVILFNVYKNVEDTQLS